MGDLRLQLGRLDGGADIVPVERPFNQRMKPTVPRLALSCTTLYGRFLVEVEHLELIVWNGAENGRQCRETLRDLSTITRCFRSQQEKMVLVSRKQTEFSRHPVQLRHSDRDVISIVSTALSGQLHQTFTSSL